MALLDHFNVVCFEGVTSVRLVNTVSQRVGQTVRGRRRHTHTQRERKCSVLHINIQTWSWLRHLLLPRLLCFTVPIPTIGVGTCRCNLSLFRPPLDCWSPCCGTVVSHHGGATVVQRSKTWKRYILRTAQCEGGGGLRRAAVGFKVVQFISRGGWL